MNRPAGQAFVPVHPGANSVASSLRMQRLRRRDTRPELAVRSLLHRSGFRYRVVYPVPGLPRRSIDVAFTRQRVAVFVDGCFWHRCADHGTVPAANRTWWETKLARTWERDRETDDALRAAGWVVLRFWEHDDPRDVLTTVRNVLHQ